MYVVNGQQRKVLCNIMAYTISLTCSPIRYQLLIRGVGTSGKWVVGSALRPSERHLCFKCSFSKEYLWVVFILKMYFTQRWSSFVIVTMGAHRIFFHGWANYLEYTTFRYWHDVRIQSLYLGQYMRNVPYWLNIGSILHQYGCATRGQVPPLAHACGRPRS